MTRLGCALVAAALLVAPLGGAPRAQCDYYLTGNAGNVAVSTRVGLGLMGGGTDVDALFTWMGGRRPAAISS